jgi:hypothetical protein
LPILKVEDPQLEREVYTFTYSNGLFLKALEDYYGGSRTLLGATRVATKVAAGLLLRNHWVKPVPCRVTVDNQELPYKENVFTLAATIRKLLFGLAPFAPTPEKPVSRFHTLCCDLTPGEAIRHLPSYIQGKRKHERLFNDTAHELVIEGQDGYILDGEVYRRRGPYRVRITCGPTLRLLNTRNGNGRRTVWGERTWNS